MMEKARIKRVVILFLCLSCFVSTAEAVTKELTNPLLRYVTFRELRPFQSKVEELIKNEQSTGKVRDVAVYFRSLSDGMWFGINENEKFSPASLLKVPVMMAYLKLAESDPDILKKKYAYRAPHEVPPANIKSPTPREEGQY